MQCVAAVRPAAAVQRPAVRSASSSSAFVGSSLRAAPLRAQTLRPARRQVCVAGLFGLGVPELAVIAGVAALIFGPSKLPELGKGLGKTVKSFQNAAKEFETELKAATADDAEQPKQPAAGEKKDETPAPKQ